MAEWNALQAGQPALSLTPAQSHTTVTSQKQLEQQTITPTAASGSTPAFRTLSKNPVCWMGQSNCASSTSGSATSTTTPAQNQLGWFIQLPGTNQAPAGTVPMVTTYEQVIFDPTLSPDGELVVNTYIPTNDASNVCQVLPATGFTMAMEPDTGGGSPTSFFVINSTTNADGVQLGGSGIPSLISSGHSGDQNAEYLITQTVGGTPAPPVKTNRHAIVSGERLNWIERR
jgi:type IV pilus assembly protein PilY1